MNSQINELSPRQDRIFDELDAEADLYNAVTDHIAHSQYDSSWLQFALRQVRGYSEEYGTLYGGDAVEVINCACRCTEVL